jgi:peptide/nickel transport system permease protein
VLASSPHIRHIRLPTLEAAMQRYILRRLFFAVPVLLLTSVIVFSLLHTVPGDVIVAKLADQGTVKKEDIETMRRQYGLDKPLVQQYLIWLGRLVRGDLGSSIYTEEAIRTSLRRSMPVTLELALWAMLISVLIGVPMGIFSAVFRNTPGDYIGRVVAILGLSAPDFWVATMAITVLAIQFQWIPPVRYQPLWEDPVSNLKQFALPALIVGFRLSAAIMRMTRSTLLEVLREDYVRTAYAKGLRDRAVIFRHALKNAFLPVVTIMGGQIAFLLGGAVIIETIFVLPGMGRLAVQGLTFRDYPLVQTLVMLFAAIVVLANLVVDISYAWLDPRIRYR